MMGIQGMSVGFVGARVVVLYFVVLALLLGVAVATPAYAAPVLVAPADGVPDVRNPGAAGRTVYHQWNSNPYRAVLVSPGIAVSNVVHEEDIDEGPARLLSADEWQDYANNVRRLIDETRAVELGRTMVDSIPDLLSPEATGGWRSGLDGPLSDVAVVVASPADHSTVAMTRGIGAAERSLAGEGGLLLMDPSQWGKGEGFDAVQFDPVTGRGAMMSARASFEHELFHVAQNLAGATPHEVAVEVPTPRWTTWPPNPDIDPELETVGVELAETLTQGGPRGLTATREFLTSPGAGGAPAAFSVTEYDSINTNPYLNRAYQWAWAKYRAAEVGSAKRLEWLKVANARWDIAVSIPTEIALAKAHGEAPSRREYQPSGFPVDGESVTLLPVRTLPGYAAEDAADPMRSDRVTPVEGTWENPRMPGELSGASWQCAACGGTFGAAVSAENVDLFNRRVAGEVARVQGGAVGLGDAVGDAVGDFGEGFSAESVESLVRSPEWVGFEGSIRALGGMDVGSAEVSAAVADALPLMVAAFTEAVMSEDPVAIAKSVFPPVMMVEGVIAAVRDEDYISMASMVAFGLSAVVGPEVANPLAWALIATSIWSHPSDVTQCLTPDQRMVLSYNQSEQRTLLNAGPVMAASVAKVAMSQESVIRYRASYLQAQVDLVELAQGWDPDTVGMPGVEAMKQQISDAAEESIDRVWAAGRLLADQKIRELVDLANSGDVFRAYRDAWVQKVNEGGGISTCGSVKEKVDASSLSTVNPNPIDMESYTGGDGGTIHNRTTAAYDKADKDSRGRVDLVSVEDEHLKALPSMDKEWAFSTPATDLKGVLPAAVTVLAGTGHPGQFVEVFDAGSKKPVCGVTRVNVFGLWRCGDEAGFQVAGSTATYELRSSRVDTGGFTDTGKRVMVHTAPGDSTDTLPSFSDVHVEGRTVTGLTQPGGRVQILGQDPTRAEATGTGVTLSPIVTADANGRFTVVANDDAPAGVAQAVFRNGAGQTQTRIELAKPTGTTTVIDDRTVGSGNGAWQYAGSWVEREGGTRSNTQGATVTLRFAGSGISLDALLGQNQGVVDITLDGDTTRVDLFKSGAALAQATVFTQTGLNNTPHTLVVTITGRYSSHATNNYATIARATITP